MSGPPSRTGAVASSPLALASGEGAVAGKGDTADTALLAAADVGFGEAGFTWSLAATLCLFPCGFTASAFAGGLSAAGMMALSAVDAVAAREAFDGTSVGAALGAVPPAESALACAGFAGTAVSASAATSSSVGAASTMAVLLAEEAPAGAVLASPAAVSVADVEFGGIDNALTMGVGWVFAAGLLRDPSCAACSACAKSLCSSSSSDAVARVVCGLATGGAAEVIASESTMQ